MTPSQRVFIYSLKLVNMLRSTNKDSSSTGHVVLLEDVNGIGDEGRALEMMRIRLKKALVLVRVQMKRLGMV